MISLDKYIVSQERAIDADTYSVNLTLILVDSNENIPLFSKELTSISNNGQTGFEVDIQRDNEIDAYIASLNA